MIAENPGPDNDTMETLIETNEQLTSAMNKHQRAILAARKAAGLGNGSPSLTPPGQRTDSGFAAPPPGPPPNRSSSGFAAPPGPPPRPNRKPAPQIPPPGDYAPTGFDSDHEEENPFSDPSEQSKKKMPPFPEDKPPAATGQFNDRLGIEPYHPGFRETRSYVNRQDSSANNVTMHAAAELEAPADEGANGSSRIGGAGGSSGNYGVQAGAEAPIYRY